MDHPSRSAPSQKIWGVAAQRCFCCCGCCAGRSPPDKALEKPPNPVNRYEGQVVWLPISSWLRRPSSVSPLWHAFCLAVYIHTHALGEPTAPGVRTTTVIVSSTVLKLASRPGGEDDLLHSPRKEVRDVQQDDKRHFKALLLPLVWMLSRSSEQL